MTLCLRGWASLPIHNLSKENIDNFVQRLSYVSPFADDDGKRKSINLYQLNSTHLNVPWEWLRVNYPSVFETCLTNDRIDSVIGPLEYSRLPDSNHPSVRDPKSQQAFTYDVEVALLKFNNVLAYAPTGTGKTVVALKVAAKIGLRTLILVDSNHLKEQWIKEIQDKLGIERDKIGVIQQDKCEYEDKYIVVGLLQTCARRELPEEVYNSFGTVIIDECHKLSTEFFASVVPKFNSLFKLGLSATPRRKDGSDIVLYSHLGEVRVRASGVALPVKVLVKNYYTHKKLWGKDERQRLMCLASDQERNELLVHYIKQLYEGNRNTLVVSHNLLHLEKLMQMCKRAGIPAEDIGQFTGSKLNYSSQGTLLKNKKVTHVEQEEAKTKKVVFATYKMVKEAVDVPRWDAGIDCLPDWKGTQLLGRIRRPFPGKLYPKWITFKDMKCEFSLKMWDSRLKEYQECGAEMVSLAA